MLFRVLNRYHAERYIESEVHMLISVTDPKAPEAKLPENEKRLDILRLNFYDLDFARELSPALLDGVSTPYFTVDQAIQVVDFFDKYRDQAEKTIVHCEAGISRSAGIAAALSRIHNNSDLFYFKTFVPNRRVYSMILSTYMERRESAVG